MRRLDAVLLLAVSAFAVFVGAQVMRATSARAATHKQAAAAPQPHRLCSGRPGKG